MTQCACIQCQLRDRYGDDLDFLNEECNDHIIGVTTDLRVAYDAHAMCNLRMLTLYSRTYQQGDDRPVEWLNIHIDGDELTKAMDAYESNP